MNVFASSTMLVTTAWAGQSDPSAPETTTANTSAPGEVPVVEHLQKALPHAHIKTRNGRMTRVHGPSLATGHAPDASAEAFRATVLGAFGAKQNDLRPRGLALGESKVLAKPDVVGLMFDKNTNKYKYFLYRYDQYVDGIAVYDAQLLVLVKNEPNSPVVWANTSLRNIGSYAPRSAPRALTANIGKSMDAARAHAVRRPESGAAPVSLSDVDQPELVIFAGAGDDNAPPRLAMRYSAGAPHATHRWHFVADPHTGDILHTQSPMQSASGDVSGTVRANVTVDPIAADCAPEQSMPLEHAEVGLTGGAPRFTSADGSFSIDTNTTPVEVYSTLHGRWIDVFNFPGADERLTRTVTPPAQVQFLHNEADDQEFVIAQANAYYHLNLARDFLLRYHPNYPYISTTEHLRVTVNGDETTPGYRNMPGVCPGTAWHFDGHQFLFCKHGNGVRNTAFGTVAYHEFGHEIVESAPGDKPYGDQGQYGEGIGDSLALLMTGDPRLGIGFNDTDCTNVRRDASNPVCQYDAANCTTNCGDASDTHGCGRLLSGIVWDLREALRVTHPNDYQDIVSALVLNSVPMHSGMGIDGDIEIDLLTLDDHNGDDNIYNGTPHSSEICSAFAHHGIPCPINTDDRPCAGICSNPVAFTWSGSYQSGPLGTGAVCRETTQPIVGGNCANLAGGRTLSVNGTVVTCNGQNWTSIPARRNGGYCVTAPAGDHSWAYFSAW